MFCIYLYVLLPCQRHLSCLLFVDTPKLELGVVVYVGLEAGLVVQVRDTPFTGSVSQLIRPLLLSLLDSEELLHKDTRYPLFYFKNVQ
jgi:hypothetical protein